MTTVFRPDLFSGAVVLVTGGGSGIGRGIAHAFARHGAAVAILGRKPERLQEAAAAISADTGARVLTLAADVRDAEAVDAAIVQTLDALGRLDVVVNSAAGNFLAPAAGLSGKGYRTVLDIDAVGTFQVCRAAFDRYLRDHGGCIINISATLHYGATAMQIHAASAKAAVDTLTRTLALEWGPAGIRVVGIAPGPIADTEGMARLMAPGVAEKATRGIPLRRFGRIDEIASVALFLASDAASLVTGDTLVVDGGAWLPSTMTMALTW